MKIAGREELLVISPVEPSISKSDLKFSHVCEECSCGVSNEIAMHCAKNGGYIVSSLVK